MSEGLPFSFLKNAAVLFLLFSPATQTNQQSPGSGHLLLTEVYYNTPGNDAEREWVELANLGEKIVDLSEFKLGDEESIWGGEGMLRFPEGSTIAPGQVAVVAQTATGYRALYGRDPDYEIDGSIPQVPDMRRYALWSSGDLALANDGDEVLLLDSRNQIIDGINYGDKLTYFSPSISNVFTGQSIERTPATCDTDTAADWQPQRYPTPGKVQSEGDCAVHAELGLSDLKLLSIGQIQGKGETSPYINELVEFRGVVTGFYEDRNAAGIIFYTLFVQDMPGMEDGDSVTSDGIAVFLGRTPPEYKPGDIVRISGKVTEFFGLTEIDDEGLGITNEGQSSPIPDPEPLRPPAAESAKEGYYETLEGSLVMLPFAARVVGPTHAGCGFAVVDTASFDQPLPLRQTEEHSGPVLSILHNSDVDCQDIPQLKTGDQVSGLAGPMIYHFDRYKIVQQDMSVLDVNTSAWPEVPVAQQLSENQFSIATFNLENYFDEKRDSTNSAEPIFDEFSLNVKRQKLAHVISTFLACPTFVAVQEVENEALLRELVEKLGVLCGFNYQISHSDSPDSRGLDVALLSNPHRVQIAPAVLRQTCTTIDTGIEDQSLTCPDGQSPLFGRPPLQVEVLVDGQPYVFLVNHFKSKRGEEDETEVRRIQQASFVHDLVNEILAADSEAGVVVLGDINDYELSPTMGQLTEGDTLQDVLQLVPQKDRYSYIFDGRSQLIDGILVSEAIKSQVAIATIVHINADYPTGLAHDTSSDGLPYHGSDHDIPLIVLNLTVEKQSPTDVEPSPTPLPTPAPQTVKQSYPVSTPAERPQSEQLEYSSWVIWLASGLIIMTIVSLLLFLKQRLR